MKFMFSLSTLSHANLQQPFRTLAIKWELNIFLKKSSCVLHSCVILHASIFLRASVFTIIESLWYGTWLYNSMVKFDFLAQFPVDHLYHPSRVYTLLVLIYCIRLLCDFISITTYPTFAIFLRHIYFCLNIVGPYGVVLCPSEKRFSLSLKVSLS